MQQYTLDESKILWHQDRIQAWARGERVYPINIDMALTRACNYSCEYCFGKTQENEGHTITKKIIDQFIKPQRTQRAQRRIPINKKLLRGVQGDLNQWVSRSVGQFDDWQAQL